MCRGRPLYRLLRLKASDSAAGLLGLLIVDCAAAMVACRILLPVSSGDHVRPSHLDVHMTGPPSGAMLSKAKGRVPSPSLQTDQRSLVACYPTVVTPLPVALLFDGSGSPKDCPTVIMTVPVTGNWWLPACMHVTFHVLLTETGTPIGTVRPSTVVVVAVVAVQSAGKASENITSTMALGSGPLLCVETVADTWKGTPGAAAAGAVTLTLTAFMSAPGAGVGDGVGAGVPAQPRSDCFSSPCDDFGFAFSLPFEAELLAQPPLSA